MKPKTILITGSTSGIGKSAALELAKHGHTVFATGRRMEALEALRNDYDKPNLVLQHLDVTDTASIERAMATIQRHTNSIDVLINNAGYAQFGPAVDIGDEALRRQFDVNVFGLMAMTRACASAMMKRGTGRIINVSSIGGRMVFPFGGAYQATKFAVEALSDAMRVELAAFGVQVILIEPGPIETGFMDTANHALAPIQAKASAFTEAMDTYSYAMQQTYRFAPGPEVVTKAIVHAVEARRPRARYVMPFQSRVMVFLYEHMLPTWLVDAVYIWILKQRWSKSESASMHTAATQRP